MNKNIKKIMIITLLFILMFVVLSSSFIAYDTEHINHCHKENCNTCNVINISKYFLTNLIVLALIYLSVIKHVKLIFYQERFKRFLKYKLNTLIALKVQFNT